MELWFNSRRYSGFSENGPDFADSTGVDWEDDDDDDGDHYIDAGVDHDGDDDSQCVVDDDNDNDVDVDNNDEDGGDVDDSSSSLTGCCGFHTTDSGHYSSRSPKTPHHPTVGRKKKKKG